MRLSGVVPSHHGAYALADPKYRKGKVRLGLVLVLMLAVVCVDFRVGDLTDPHQHFGDVHATRSNSGLLRGVEFEPIAKIPDVQRQATHNKSGERTVFVASGRVDYVDYEPDLLFVVNRRNSKAYRTLNRDFPHRPISDINWLTDEFVCFDVWTGPHYGVHYVVDASRPKIVHAIHFHDAFIEEIERSGQECTVPDGTMRR